MVELKRFGLRDSRGRCDACKSMPSMWYSAINAATSRRACLSFTNNQSQNFLKICIQIHKTDASQHKQPVSADSFCVMTLNNAQRVSQRSVAQSHSLFLQLHLCTQQLFCVAYPENEPVLFCRF